MSIAESVAQASAYLTDHPDEARYRDSAATAQVVDGLVIDVTGPAGERLRTDMPAGIGGTASAPSPGWFLRAAIASCVASLIVIRAAATGAGIGSVKVEVDSESDDRGILGLDPDIPAGALSARIIVTVDTDLDHEAKAELINWAVEHCPVSESIARAVPLTVDIR